MNDPRNIESFEKMDRLIERQRNPIKDYTNMSWGHSIEFWSKNNNSIYINATAFGSFKVGSIIKVNGEKGYIPYIVVEAKNFNDPKDMYSLKLFQIPTVTNDNQFINFFDSEEILLKLSEKLIEIINYKETNLLKQIFSKSYKIEKLCFAYDENDRIFGFMVNGKDVCIKHNYDDFKKLFRKL